MKTLVDWFGGSLRASNLRLRREPPPPLRAHQGCRRRVSILACPVPSIAPPSIPRLPCRLLTWNHWAIGPTVSARRFTDSPNARALFSPILGTGGLILMVFWAAPLPAATGAAVAGVSASVGSLVSSIHTANTGFLTQSSAFIGSPADPQPDQQGGGVWARGIGGHMTSRSTSNGRQHHLRRARLRQYRLQSTDGPSTKKPPCVAAP